MVHHGEQLPRFADEYQCGIDIYMNQFFAGERLELLLTAVEPPKLEQ